MLFKRFGGFAVFFNELLSLAIFPKRPSHKQAEAANQIRRAIERTLAAGYKTPDLGGKMTTEEMGSCVIDHL